MVLSAAMIVSTTLPKSVTRWVFGGGLTGRSSSGMVWPPPWITIAPSTILAEPWALPGRRGAAALDDLDAGHETHLAELGLEVLQSGPARAPSSWSARPSGSPSGIGTGRPAGGSVGIMPGSKEPKDPVTWFLGWRHSEPPRLTTDPPSPANPAHAAEAPEPLAARAVASWASTPAERKSWAPESEIGASVSPVFFSPEPSLVAVTLPVPFSCPATVMVSALAPARDSVGAAMAGVAAIAPSATAPTTDARRRYERFTRFLPRKAATGAADRAYADGGVRLLQRGRGRKVTQVSGG